MKNSPPKSVDKVLLFLIALLTVVGFLVFSSASLGLMARSGPDFKSVAFGQFFFGLVGGTIALIITSHIHYRHWRKYAFYIFIFSIILTLAVFIPGLGMSHGGATRWLDLRVATIQPSEVLKVGFIIYVATLLSGVFKKMDNWKMSVLPFALVVAGAGIVMLSLPDTDTFLIMALSALAMFVTAGAKWRHTLALTALAGVLLLGLVFMRPYLMDRFMVLLNPGTDLQGDGYQIHQSLIAVGSGGVLGRGYGQSIQKFEYLPEPTSDSIFAVFAEEFGFVGTSLLILIFVTMTLRCLKIASTTSDMFGALLVVGISSAVIFQAFLNIASMIGLFPLSGLPLPLISHGGTALMTTLAALGIVLNVSKYQKQTKHYAKISKV